MTTILVVDDSALDRRLAGGLLTKQAGWDVVYAADGREALAAIEDHIPDLILTDLQMPHVNGLELVAAVKRDYRLIPVILMTAQGSEEIAVQALQQGAASYVPKKRLAKDLVATVEQVLSTSSHDRSEARLTARRLVRQESSFILENDLALIASLVNYLQQDMERARLYDETDRLRLGIALDEALLNAYYHGNLEIDSSLREQSQRDYFELASKRSKELPYRDRRIYVDARMTRDEIVYVVRDDGPGFDPQQLPDPTDPNNLDRPCGRGVLLMRTFMDEVTYNETGNQVTLIKRRARTSDNGNGTH